MPIVGRVHFEELFDEYGFIYILEPGNITKQSSYLSKFDACT